MSGSYRCYNSSVFASLLVPYWYVSNRKKHEVRGFPLFVDVIRALTESFDSKTSDLGTPYYGNSADV